MVIGDKYRSFPKFLYKAENIQSNPNQQISTVIIDIEQLMVTQIHCVKIKESKRKAKIALDFMIMATVMLAKCQNYHDINKAVQDMYQENNAHRKQPNLICNCRKALKTHAHTNAHCKILVKK